MWEIRECCGTIVGTPHRAPCVSFSDSADLAGYVSLSIDELRMQLEAAHMAGQADAGVDPGYSNARAYTDSALKQFDT